MFLGFIVKINKLIVVFLTAIVMNSIKPCDSYTILNAYYKILMTPESTTNELTGKETINEIHIELQSLFKERKPMSTEFLDTLIQENIFFYQQQFPEADFFLNLSDSGITEIPECIGCLTSLVYLNLNNNNLHDLPNSIGNLKNLYKLNLANNGFSTLPSTIQELSTLIWIDIRGNHIIELPEYIKYMQENQGLSVEF